MAVNQDPPATRGRGGVEEGAVRLPGRPAAADGLPARAVNNAMWEAL